MSNKRIFSVTAIFDKPDEIIHAAEKVSDSIYSKYDIHTPYPVHGMDDAMKLKPSTLGYFALALGLSGTAIALLFMWWTMSVDYPLVIGGKAFFALPALIPITFEVTVLMASVGTVIGMLFYFFKMPNNSYPLHDTSYMKSVSRDKFGVCIEAIDKNFDEAAVTEFLKSIGGKEVSSIYYDEEWLGFRPKVFNLKFIGFLFITAIVTSMTFYFLLNKLGFMAPFNFMMDQPRFDVQSSTEFFENGSTMLVPVEGTIARGFMPYPFKGMHDSVSVGLINPIEPTEAVIEKGKIEYDIYCSPCHGYLAEGDGRLNGNFPNPPSLHTDKLRDWKDGQIYHVITEGQNSMPTYARQIPREDRWKIVHYIRTLQRAMNAKEEDMR